MNTELQPNAKMASRPTTARHRKLAWGVVIACCIVTGLLVGGLVLMKTEGGKNLVYYSMSHVSHSTIHSNRPYQETQAQIVKRDGLIFVKAKIGEKTYDCMLDTGSPDSTWPAPLALAQDQLVTLPSQVQWVGAEPTASTSALLPRLAIANFAVDNLISWKQNYDVQGTSARYRKQHRAYSQPYVVLGNSTFRNNVITVDYEKGLLIIRNSTFDLHRDKNDFVLPFAVEGGHILVAGTVEGKPANLLVDTGTSSLVISREFDGNSLSSRLLRRHHGNSVTTSNYGATTMPFVRSIKGSIGNDAFCAQGVLDKTPGANDAIIGTRILENYRVTIDYSRNLIGFQRWASTHNTPASGPR